MRGAVPAKPLEGLAMRTFILLGAAFFISTSFANADERKVDFEKMIGPRGTLTQRIMTYKGATPSTKTCEGGCPSPQYKWTCKDNESCGINCAEKPASGYCY